MVSVALRNGETTSSAHLLPLSVDGLVVVASISLVEIGARIRTGADLDEQAENAGETPAETETAVPVTAPNASPGSETDRPAEEAAVPAATGTAPANQAGDRRKGGRPAGRSAAATVTRLRAKHPEWTAVQIATRAGVSVRTVRRHLNASPSSDVATAGGSAARLTAI